LPTIKSITETLLDLTDSLRNRGEHTFVKLGKLENYEHQTDSLGQRSDLGVGSGGISHERHRFLLVITELWTTLMRVRVVVMQTSVMEISDESSSGK
jgi:hypothetical protein